MGKTRVVGLDIGSTAVRAVELEFGSGGPSGRHQPTLVRCAEIALPPGAVQDAEVAEPETVASTLKDLWRRGKFSTRDVVLGVGNPRVVVRELELPWAPMAQLRASLRFQVQELLPMPVDEALLDYYPTAEYQGSSGRTLQGMLVAASRETVRSNVMAAESAGLRPGMVDLNAFALLRGMARGEFADKVVALVDVGARVTNVIISAHGVPRFARTLPSGGNDVTDALAGQMQMSGPDAERLKREIGVGYPVAPELSLGANAVSEVTRNLVEAIRNTFVYYSSNNPGSGLDVALLTGGGGLLPGLAQYLSTASRLPVTYGDPLATLKVGADARKHLPESISLLAIPVGLAMGVAA
ncbi:type IV pilus assembly protein PilM [Actinotalea sp. K2]|uniref:type IV pilus assembly protein PilM n=1 Tax=Actinotalea sp. K2 TaxID=2939438 RepID=UPI002016BC7B|nr:type IV pilus assembly protein PilM [Actinotalea sp. K2]MCL3862845.1 type IV pilus assembly protein PilM [Actinotalea sp. K2]